MPTITCHDKTFCLFRSEEQIRARLQEIGAQINATYANKTPIFIGVLNGAFRVLNGLLDAVDITCEISFVKLKSYDGTQSKGEVQTLLGLDLDVANRHLIIVEDIIDTGTTLDRFLPKLQALKPASIAVCTLLLKPESLQYELPLDYVGFEVPNKFLIGYGLDYNGYGRQHNALYQLNE